MRGLKGAGTAGRILREVGIVYLELTTTL